MAIYLLPSFFSLTNLFFGFLSISFCFQRKYSWAAFFVLIGAILDGFDGIIARLTKTQSDFGIELDSLADAISFGAAPSLLLYFWALKAAGPAGKFFSFVYLAAGILRLARYNIRTKMQPDRKHYTGLTIPSAAVFISSIIFLHPQALNSKPIAFLLAVVTLLVSSCMISTIKYKNFLSFNIRKKINIKTALIIAVIVSSLIFYRKIFLFCFFTINVLSGPATYVYNFLKKKIQKRRQEKRIPSQKTA
jgi:CDP-diacylglycerol--serine O-phosphatidyltransferase